MMYLHNYKKNARVKVIKNNILKGEIVPNFKQDNEIGQWVDQKLSERGHTVDQSGIVDLPEYGIDNKTRKQGSKAHHTVGSMTIQNIIDTVNWVDTRYYKKSLNQNQIIWSEDFQEVVEVSVLDMDLPEIQTRLNDAYNNLRQKIANNVRTKNIVSDCGWAVLDGYNHPGSYRFRITNSAMTKIKNLSKSRDVRKRLFEEE